MGNILENHSDSFYIGHKDHHLYWRDRYRNRWIYDKCYLLALPHHTDKLELTINQNSNNFEIETLPLTLGKLQNPDLGSLHFLPEMFFLQIQSPLVSQVCETDPSWLH